MEERDLFRKLIGHFEKLCELYGSNTTPFSVLCVIVVSEFSAAIVQPLLAKGVFSSMSTREGSRPQEGEDIDEMVTQLGRKLHLTLEERDAVELPRV
ncbi:hypothetical protein Droror1_Dr00011908 [Drosera rotundifolia]